MRSQRIHQIALDLGRHGHGHQRVGYRGPGRFLLEDVLRLSHGITPLRNEDVRNQLEPLAKRVSFDWLRAAVARVDQLVLLVRRNIQKSIALDAFAAELRGGA